ncbi:hypothetical protein HYU95_05990 [Candidatus Daviesbacteria bacterium]|nr:hypothetical protein [Candidatus Daviesbacteria bacterium]
MSDTEKEGASAGDRDPGLSIFDQIRYLLSGQSREAFEGDKIKGQEEIRGLSEELTAKFTELIRAQDDFIKKRAQEEARPFEEKSHEINTAWWTAYELARASDDPTARTITASRQAGIESNRLAREVLGAFFAHTITSNFPTKETQLDNWKFAPEEGRLGEMLLGRFLMEHTKTLKKKTGDEIIDLPLEERVELTKQALVGWGMFLGAFAGMRLPMKDWEEGANGILEDIGVIKKP